MAEATSVGAVELNLEVNGELGDDIGISAKDIADKIRKQVDSMREDMFKNLRLNMTQSLEKMNQSVTSVLDKTKAQMQSFVEYMSTALSKISSVQMPYSKATSEAEPNTTTSSTALPRGPPSLSVQKPKIKFDPQFDTEMFHQKYAELENMMDMYDNQITQKQAQRKQLLDTYSPKMNETAQLKLDKQVASLDMQIAKLQDVASRTNISLSAMDRQLQSTATATKTTSSSVSGLSSSLRSLSLKNTALNGLLSGLTMLKSGLAKATSAASQFMKKISSKVLNTIGNKFKQAGNAAGSFAKKLLTLGTSSKKASSGMGSAHRGIGSLIRQFTLFSLIFPIVSRGIMALGQNLGATLMTNSQFADSLNQIRSNLATAFTPIFQAIMPALNALMSGLAQVTAYISAFVSLLFGKTVGATRQATQGIYSAKEVMGAYGDSASDASKKAEKAMRTLMGFDEINKLDENSDTDTGSGGGGGGGGAPIYTPTDVDISGISNIIDKIKEMFKKGDYAGIGKYIGEGINKGVAKLTKWISWDNVGEQITKFINGFCDMFNALIETIDWFAIGRLFGTGINTLANTLYLLLNRINWTNIGGALANGINGLVHTVDWSKFGATVGSLIQAAIDALYGFVTTADWPAIGKALADAVMGLVDRVDLVEFATALGKGISGVVSSIHNFVNDIDWSELGQKIADSINEFFSNINWADLGMTLSDAVLGILDLLITAFKETDWIAIGVAFGDALINIDWVGIIAEVGKLLVLATVSLIGVLGGAFSKLAKSMWDGLCQGIEEFFNDPGAFIKEHIVDPFVNWFRELFGIHSPSTVMAELGRYLIEGLKNGIVNLIPDLLSNIGSWFGGIGTKISETWNDVKTWTKETWTSVKTSISDKCSDIGKSISGAWENAKSWTSETWSSIKTTVSEKASDVARDVKNGFQSAKEAVTTKCSEIKTGVTEKFSEVTGYLGGLKNTFWSKATDMWNSFTGGSKSVDVKGTMTNIMNKVSSAVTDVTTNANTWGSDMMSGLASGIRNATGWVTNAVSNVANKISSWLHFSRPDVGPLHYYEEWMPDFMQGLAKGIENSTPNLMNKVRNLAESMSLSMQQLSEPTIAFAGEQNLKVQHEFKESHKNSETSLKDVLDMIEALTEEIKNVKQVIVDKDNDVYLDGESIKENTVERINKNTRKNGVCEIDM